MQHTSVVINKTSERSGRVKFSLVGWWVNWPVQDDTLFDLQGHVYRSAGPLCAVRTNDCHCGNRLRKRNRGANVLKSRFVVPRWHSRNPIHLIMPMISIFYFEATLCNANDKYTNDLRSANHVMMKFPAGIACSSGIWKIGGASCAQAR